MATKAGKETAERLNKEIADAVAGAAYFIISIYVDGSYRKFRVDELKLAREGLPLIERQFNNGRRAMIYALRKDGTTVLVPPSWNP